MRHFRDIAACQRRDSFFGDPLDRQQLLSEARLDRDEVRNQPLIDQTSVARGRTSRRNLVGASPPMTSLVAVGSTGRKEGVSRKCRHNRC
jgi:hypothetical protein